MIRKHSLSNIMFKRIGGALLICFASLSSGAQDSNWQALKAHKLFTFDLDCAEKASLPRALSDTVRKAIPPKENDSDQIYVNLAVAVKLDEQGQTVYFVPTLCGKEHCRWSLYTINPVQSLGEIKGNSLITYHSLRGMPTIVATSIVDTFTTGVTTYSFDPAVTKYRQVGDTHKYVVDQQIKTSEGQLPEFLRKPAVLMPQCKNMIQ